MLSLNATNKKVRQILPMLGKLSASFKNIRQTIFQVNLASRGSLGSKGFRIQGTQISDPRFMKMVTPKMAATIPHPEGSMFLFSYTAEHEDKLPYYDRFPLIILLNRDEKGFEGINLHYIPMEYRIKTMLFLSRYILLSPQPGVEPRFVLTYDILKNDPTIRHLAFAYRRYTNKYMQSVLFEIDPDHWGNVLYMPFELFVKDGIIIPSRKVWEDQIRLVMDHYNRT